MRTLNFILESDDSILGGVLGFIERCPTDWKIVVVAPFDKGQDLLSKVQFTAPSHLGLARSARCLRCAAGSILHVDPTSTDLLEGLESQRLIIVIHSTILTTTVVNATLAARPYNVVLWTPD